MDTNSVLIITGPTGSGKTGLSELMAKNTSIEVINADVGQFYKPLSIGTAKPTWQDYPFPCHLFDYLDEPKDLSVTDYRSIIIDLVKRIHQRGNLPVLVGGSFFYLKSLFFPPKKLILKECSSLESPFDKDLSSTQLWEQLNAIDVDRAKVIHPHDSYRIERALTIWHQTGKKPSTFSPTYEHPFNTTMVLVDLAWEVLKERIRLRTNSMLEAGWIDEAKTLYGTSWKPFLKRKGLIGYDLIFDWLDQGGKELSKEALIKEIQQETIHYAKRQRTFMYKFMRQLDGRPSVTLQTCSIIDQATVLKIINSL